MKNKFIMIIDDDPDETAIFCEAIETFDSNVQCINFNQPEKALEYLQNQQSVLPNWIFLDLNMPRIDGIECLKRIKTINHLSSVPVIMYSTSSLKADIENTKKLGANGYLIKPDNFEKIYIEAKKWMI